MARADQLIAGAGSTVKLRPAGQLPGGRWFVAVVISLALHGAIWVLAVTRDTGSSVQQGRFSDLQPAAKVAVRLLGPPVAAASTSEISGAASSGEVAEALPSTSQLPPAALDLAAAESPALPAPVETGQQLLLPDETAPVYLPRSALSRAPVPLTEVELPWPSGGLLAVGRLAGIFWLFINESGTVDRFEADDSSLPPQLEEVARAAFLSARFDPGQLDGRAVKSLIKIEVVFDNRSPVSHAPKVVSEQTL